MRDVLRHVIAAVVVFPVAAIAYLWQTKLFWPNPLVDLSGEWRFCHTDASFNTAECEWRNIRLPSDLPLVEGSRFTGFIVYRKEVTLPDLCQEGECALVAAEVGDATRVFVSGRRLGEFGRFPPDVDSRGFLFFATRVR